MNEAPPIVTETSVLELYNTLLSNEGAKWLRSDLHIHTPASHDFKQKSLTPHEYVTAIQKAGIGLVGLADHSSAAWVDALKIAARDLKKQGRIGILPGVELSIGGIHVVLLFPETYTTAHIEHILSKLDIEPDDRGRPNTVCTTKTVIETIQIAHDQGGIAIAAHCLSDQTGLVKASQGQARLQALELIDAVELKPGQSVPSLQQRLSQLTKRQIPVIVSSDAHHPSELTQDVSFLKMVRPTFRGAAQIRYEPIDRVAHNTPSSSTHPQIVGFQVDQGLLADVPVRFSPHLNTLIGGRGTGKSAVLDILRFGLGVDARMPENQAILNNRISSFVGQGGAVRVFFKDAHGRTYCSVRRGDFSTANRGGVPQVTFTERPTAFQLIDERFVEVAQAPSDLLPIEFFGQGEVMDLSKKAQDQLAMLDEHVNFGTLKLEEQKIISQLTRDGQEVIKLELEVDRLQQLVDEAPRIEARIEILNQELKNPVFMERAQWDREAAFLNWARAELEAIKIESSRERPTPSAAPAIESSSPNKPLCADISNVLASLADLQAAQSNELGLALGAAEASIARCSGDWQVRNQSNLAAYKEALRQAGGLELQSLQRERAEKSEQLHALRENEQPNLERIQSSLEALQEAGRLLLVKLGSIRDAIHSTRQEQLEILQGKLSSVRVKVLHNADRRDYQQKLRTIYQGSGIQSAETQLERIVEQLLPADFAALVLAGDEAALVAATGVTSATANKLLRYPSRDQLLEISVMAVSDMPVIEMKRAGESTFTPLDKLSDGERCSAVLSVALLEKDRPLLIDQPEDELDHQYVIDDVVANMKSIKKIRQIIVATHDPNIPVLGDAELILRVTKELGVAHCDFLAEGPLEVEPVLDAVLSLEGGYDAFERRSRKYSMT